LATINLRLRVRAGRAGGWGLLRAGRFGEDV